MRTMLANSDSSFTYADRREISNRTQKLPADKLSRALGIIFGDDNVTQKMKEFTVDFGALDDAKCYKLAALIKTQDASARVGPSRPKAPKAKATKAAKSGKTHGGGGANGAASASRKRRPGEGKSGEPTNGGRPAKKPRAGAQDNSSASARGGSRYRTGSAESASASARPGKRARSGAGAKSPAKAAAPPMPETGRVEVRINKEGPEFRPGSVLGKKKGRILVLFDDDRSLRWIAASNNRRSTWRDAQGFDDVQLPKGGTLTALRQAERSLSRHVSKSFCEKVLSTLWSLEASDPFMTAGAPAKGGRGTGRVSVSASAMTFHHVREKVVSKSYKNTADFAYDVRCVLANLLRDEDFETENGKMALILKSVFEYEWKTALATADAGEGSDPESELPPPEASRGRGEASRKLTRFQEEVARSDSNPRQTTRRAQPPPGSASHKNLHANLDDRIVGRRIQVFWDGDSQWYTGTIEEYDADTRQHRLRYAPDDEEWIDLHTEPFTFAIDEKGTPVQLIQRIGRIVVAKAANSPWWPAEICLPCTSTLDDFEDAGRADRLAGLPSEARVMVLYFGEDQYDVLPSSKVKDVASSTEPRKGLKPRGKDDVLDAAWDLAALRAMYLGQGDWKTS
uniref:PWWP domain-containing protein n=1 Tax=Phaeomonas parva TaxID=124430 RepID=A0A7S1TNL7_9STRA|mmetsp:Transcript_10567/g.31904  ORF Transcript_10567/g.31904 Transcript_10567/m.31904 type:complete len:626 (+) Transcript_10567:319-2196(+)